MTSPATSAHELVQGTFAALLAPRRLVPILVVVCPLLALEVIYTHTWRGVFLGGSMCAAFVLLAPLLWRAWFPTTVGPNALPFPVRLLAYGIVGALVMQLVGRTIPFHLGFQPSFLSSRPSLLVSTALFWVGGWGLARDIDMELNLEHERARAVELERAAEAAQLLALKNHLDPHFLFNTLNAIAEWCRIDGRIAEKAILELSAVLRTMLDAIHDTSWPLGRELDLGASVISLFRIRDPESFTYDVSVGEGVRDVSVPPMLLLPLFENAMKHGPHAGHRGLVSLDARIEGGRLLLTLENPGKFGGAREGSHGVGIVEKRLGLAYGARAQFTLGPATDAARTCARLVLPIADLTGSRENVRK